MSQKRWDIEVLFFTPPLMMQGPIWYKGPVIRIGRNPGPGEMNLSSYQGVAELHATIEAYDGLTIMLSAIEPYEVRVAPHENVDWNHVYPIVTSVKITEGDVIHLGSLDRGCRFRFVQCRSFDWRQEQLGAVINQEEDEFVHNRFDGPQRIQSHVPKWVLPMFLGSTVIFVAALVTLIVSDPPIPPMGIEFEDEEAPLEFVADETMTLEKSILEGFEQPFEDFVMSYNAKKSGLKDIQADPRLWDEKYYEKTVLTVNNYAKYKNTWQVFESALNNYNMIVSMLRKADMPEVFAAIPVTETKYNKDLVSPVCAAGIWQFMPEVAIRVNLKVRGCSFKAPSPVKDWQPTLKVSPTASKREYMKIVNTSEGTDYQCQITKCSTDDRIDIEQSTEGAIELFGEVWNDDLLSESGSVVQMTIVGHNVGHNDEVYGLKRETNILPAYKKYRKKSKKEDGVHFYGDNILCDSSKDPHKPDFYSSLCGGYLPNQGQHYGYNVTAQHFLAVCYYAENYGNDSVFTRWKRYLKGYCSNITIPTPEELAKKSKK